VAHGTRDRYYLVYAHDALGHLCALKGDREGFLTHSARCDALGWDSELPSAKAEILLYRGLSYRALGEIDVARGWLTRAVQFAEANHYNQTLFRAEEALRALGAARPEERTGAPTTPTAPREVREGLRAMRQELVGAGA
jgi:tetratricopeptide (TPR) repeat protein